MTRIAKIGVSSPSLTASNTRPAASDASRGGVSGLVARPPNLIYALTSWTHSPASSLQEYPAAQDTACRAALFLEAHPPSPQANELVAVMIRTNTLIDNAFIPNLLLTLLR